MIFLVLDQALLVTLLELVLGLGLVLDPDLVLGQARIFSKP